MKWNPIWATQLGTKIVSLETATRAAALFHFSLENLLILCFYRKFSYNITDYKKTFYRNIILRCIISLLLIFVLSHFVWTPEPPPLTRTPGIPPHNNVYIRPCGRRAVIGGHSVTSLHKNVGNRCWACKGEALARHQKLRRVVSSSAAAHPVILTKFETLSKFIHTHLHSFSSLNSCHNKKLGRRLN